MYDDELIILKRSEIEELKRALYHTRYERDWDNGYLQGKESILDMILDSKMQIKISDIKL